MRRIFIVLPLFVVVMIAGSAALLVPSSPSVPDEDAVGAVHEGSDVDGADQGGASARDATRVSPSPVVVDQIPSSFSGHVPDSEAQGLEQAPIADLPPVEEPHGPSEHPPGDPEALAPSMAFDLDEACTRDGPPPMPVRGDPSALGFWQSFREPLPRMEVWNPPGPPRVGLQAGHWRVEEAPAELAGLGHGTYGGGKMEWEVTLEIARQTALILAAAGVEADILPAVVPPRYQAHVFVSIHADGDVTGRLRGFKIASPSWSAVPDEDDRLVRALYDAYEQATGLRRDDGNVTRQMTAYYAFNSRRYCHAVAPDVPSAIIETGFLTNAADRELLIGRPEVPARGIADGILAYLSRADRPES